VKHVRKATLSPCGHMLHHDQPQALAALLSDFLAH
jgi:pimeloyl-ACP methyl ester carboxylesterase